MKMHAENTTYFAFLLVGNVEFLAARIQYDLHLSLTEEDSELDEIEKKINYHSIVLVLTVN